LKVAIEGAGQTGPPQRDIGWGRRRPENGGAGEGHVRERTLPGDGKVRSNSAIQQPKRLVSVLIVGCLLIWLRADRGNLTKRVDNGTGSIQASPQPAERSLEPSVLKPFFHVPLPSAVAGSNSDPEPVRAVPTRSASAHAHLLARTVWNGSLAAVSAAINTHGATDAPGIGNPSTQN